MTVKVGDKFHSAYADGNPEWEVIEKRGRGTWIATITPESLDFVGTNKAFTTEEIEGAKAMAALWDDMHDDHDAFFASLPIGAIVHYDNGFNQFVRCEVVASTTTSHGRNLKNLALVGAWREHDLPRRMADGSIYNGYHAQQIIDGAVFEPNYTNIYEARPEEEGMLRARSATIDPRDLPPIDLSVPDMSEAERVAADLVQLINDIGALCGDPAWDSKEERRTPHQKLADIYALVNSDRANGHL